MARNPLCSCCQWSSFLIQSSKSRKNLCMANSSPVVAQSLVLRDFNRRMVPSKPRDSLSSFGRSLRGVRGVVGCMWSNMYFIDENFLFLHVNLCRRPGAWFLSVSQTWTKSRICAGFMPMISMTATGQGPRSPVSTRIALAFSARLPIVALQR